LEESETAGVDADTAGAPCTITPAALALAGAGIRPAIDTG
jgi:hypothetical protein